MAPRLWKSPDVLVLGQPDGAGITLRGDRGRGVALDLAGRQAKAWLDWNDELLNGPNGSSLAVTLLQYGLAQHTHLAAPADRPHASDDLVPVPAGRHVKWYAETPDLHILFNTAAMPRHNPLLVLGPRASLVWRGISSGWSIGTIRKAIRRIFGSDGVVSFVRRLAALGFVAPFPIPQSNSTITAGEDGVIEEFLAPEVQRMIPHTAVPWYCLWEITTACDLHCRTCYVHRSAGDDLPTGQLLRIADAIATAGIFYVALLGGEPLLRQDLESIVFRLREAGIYVKIISNGLSLSLERATRLHAAGLNQVEISFDGLSAELHDRSRGPGTFSRACAAIAKVRRAGIPRGGMVLTLHSDNIGELAGLPGFMRRHGLSECYLSPFRKTGPLGGNAPWSPLGERELHHVRQLIDHWRISARDLTITFPDTCSCGRSSLVIGSHGAVRICPFAGETAGNVLQASLDRLWSDLAVPAAVNGPLGYCRARTDDQHPLHPLATRTTPGPARAGRSGQAGAIPVDRTRGSN